MRYRVLQDCFYNNSYVEQGAIVEIPKGAPVYDYFEPVRGTSAREPKGGEPEGDDAGQTARDLMNDQMGLGAPKPWSEPPEGKD